MKNRNPIIDTEDVAALYGTILQLKTRSEVKMFLRDLLTETEIVELAQRWKVANLLDQKVPYTTISETTGMSSTTIARIHKWLNRGQGGYRLMIERQKM